MVVSLNLLQSKVVFWLFWTFSWPQCVQTQKALTGLPAHKTHFESSGLWYTDFRSSILSIKDLRLKMTKKCCLQVFKKWENGSSKSSVLKIPQIQPIFSRQENRREPHVCGCQACVYFQPAQQLKWIGMFLFCISFYIFPFCSLFLSVWNDSGSPEIL